MNSLRESDSFSRVSDTLEYTTKCDSSSDITNPVPRKRVKTIFDAAAASDQKLIVYPQQDPSLVVDSTFEKARVRGRGRGRGHGRGRGRGRGRRRVGLERGRPEEPGQVFSATAGDLDNGIQRKCVEFEDECMALGQQGTEHIRQWTEQVAKAYAKYKGAYELEMERKHEAQMLQIQKRDEEKHEDRVGLQRLRQEVSRLQEIPNLYLAQSRRLRFQASSLSGPSFETLRRLDAKSSPVILSQ